MTTAEIQQLIERGEMAREHGEYPEALRYLDQALVGAADSESAEQIIDVLSHRLVMYKHLADASNHSRYYYELLYGDTLTGLHIAQTFDITGQPKAALLLRQGDYFLAKKDHAQAVELYGQAIALLDETNKGQYAEYLAYYGLALVMDGKAQEGMAQIDEAYRLAEASTDLRPFHKLIVLSGMHIRYAQAYIELKDTEKARQHLLHGKQIAQELHNEHDIPIRLDQITRLAERSNISLE